MNYIDKDIKDFDDYIEFTTFNKFNVKILFTKKHYGSVPEKSREEVAEDFSLKDKIMVSSHQTHSDNVILVGENTDVTYFENTDGILTSNKNVAILTKYADCLPVFIYDEESKIFGAVHSGWKGTYQEIVKRAIEKINPKSLSTINILFGIGISSENYKVGVEFYEQFRNKFPKEIVEKTFSIKDGNFYFNNQLFNYYLLKDYGVKEDKIFLNNRCTFKENFHSFRRLCLWRFSIMTKKFLAVSFLSLMLVACDGGNSSGNSGSGELELSQRDKELANGNPNVAAEILVQKAILQESKNEKLTEEEQYNLDLAKQEVEVSFYLQKKFDKEFSTVSNVSDEEAKKYYDEHKAEIGNTPFETIKAAIVNEIIYQKQTEIVHKYYDDLAEKYKINDILNKEYPQEVTNTEEAKTEEKK